MGEAGGAADGPPFLQSDCISVSRRVLAWAWEVMWANRLSDIHLQTEKWEQSQVTPQAPGRAGPGQESENQRAVGTWHRKGSQRQC